MFENFMNCNNSYNIFNSEQVRHIGEFHHNVISSLKGVFESNILVGIFEVMILEKGYLRKRFWKGVFESNIFEVMILGKGYLRKKDIWKGVELSLSQGTWEKGYLSERSWERDICGNLFPSVSLSPPSSDLQPADVSIIKIGKCLYFPNMFVSSMINVFVIQWY